MLTPKNIDKESVQIAFVCYALNRLDKVMGEGLQGDITLNKLNHIFECYVKNKDEASKIERPDPSNLTPDFERLIPLDNK